MTNSQVRQGERRVHGPQIVLFSGGRDCTHETHGPQIRSDVFGLTKGSIVLHGGCKTGADAIAQFYAEYFARERELHACRMDALWDAYGRSAGPRRNKAMLMVRPDFAFCYPTGGPGTQGMIELLAEAGIPHVIHGVGHA